MFAAKGEPRARVRRSATQCLREFSEWPDGPTLIVRGAAVECGTLGLDAVLTALRLERALHVYGSNEHLRFAELKKACAAPFMSIRRNGRRRCWRKHSATPQARSACPDLTQAGPDRPDRRLALAARICRIDHGKSDEVPLRRATDLRAISGTQPGTADRLPAVVWRPLIAHAICNVALRVAQLLHWNP